MTFGLGRMGNGFGRAGILSSPAWALPGFDIDMYFANSKYKGRAAADLTCSRASTGYANDSFGNWTSFANNVARITNLGLKVEEARTNSVRNNSMQGAVIGTPGTLPTNWIQSANTGLQWNVAGLGTENGIDYVDMQLVGTSAGAGVSNLYFESVTQIAASPGQSWTSSAFVKQQAGSQTNISGFDIGFAAYTNVPALISTVDSAFALTAANLGSQRVSAIGTTPATTATVEPLLVVGDSGGAVNLTIRIGWPATELGASLTTPMRTTNAAVTRAADVVTLTSPPIFGPSITLFTAFNTDLPLPVPSTNFGLVQVDDGTNNNMIETRLPAGTSAATSNVFVANVATGAAGSLNNITASVTNKVAATFNSTTSWVCTNGGAAQSGAITMPASNLFTRVLVGLGRLNQIDGFISRLAIAPTVAVPVTTLQAITSLTAYN
jgi:hypothetical protein